MNWKHISLLALPVLVLACAPPPTYSVRRAAMVPLATPVVWNGQPGQATRPVDFSFSAHASAQRPEDGGGDDGVEIPMLQLEANGRYWATDELGLRFTFHHGIAATARSVADDQPPIESSSGTFGLGAGLDISLPIDGGFRLGLTAEALVHSLSTVEVRTCVSNCEGVEPTTIDERREAVLGGALAVIPSYRSGNFTVHGGLTLRSHPTIERADFEIGGSAGGAYDSNEPSGGPGVYVVSAGADVALGSSVRLGALVFQTISEDPVRYGPAATLTLTISPRGYRPQIGVGYRPPIQSGTGPLIRVR